MIDFIGNHRSFLIKPRTLLSIAGDSSTTTKVLEAMRSGDFGLPDGCSVNYDLESVDLLGELTKRDQGPALVRFCRAFAAEHGRRPTAAQAWRAGYNPGSFRGGWFAGLTELTLLEPSDQRVFEEARDLLAALERESITKSYKLVALQAFLDLGGVHEGVPVTDLADRSLYLLKSNPRLREDAGSHLDDPAADWYRYWRRWPVAAWTGELREEPGRALFEVEEDLFRLRSPVSRSVDTGLAQLLAELVEYRLCRYLDLLETQAGTWRLRVGQTNGRPLIWLNRERNSGLPEGPTSMCIEGEFYTGLFVKIALNKVHERDSDMNRLPEILARWFGPDAGRPGTGHHVVLRQDVDAWRLTPALPDSE